MNTKIDFEKIRQDNTKYYGEWIYDPKSFVQKFFQGLYSDKTHFIFELLQNAEDTKATKVLFQLFDDCLKFHHNGRLFDEKDIKGICNFGDSTKVENLTTIGKFGIGFKSVYAYTEKPQIFSGSLSFEIEHFVLPNQMDKNYPFEKEYTTVIVLPFKTTYKKDNKTIETSPEKAVQEITKALLHLNIHTMLFLKNIKQIQYRLPEKNGKIDGGSYFRYIKKLDDNLNLVNIKNSDKFDNEQEIKNEQYLVFSREYAKNVPPIEIAFQYQDKHTDEKGKEIPAQILPMSEQNTQHCVTFATGQNTGLHFLLQGDYNTTINRESLEKDDNKNNDLIQETAELLGDILPKIKERKLLSVDFLNALPIKDKNEYDKFYLPLYKKTLELLKTDEYLPTNDGKFVSPKNAVLAYAQDLTELLSSQQLTQLLKSEKHWITREVTVNKQETINLYTYLKNQLEIKEFSRDNLKEHLDKEFLSKQSDDWLNKFYKHLNGYSSLALKPLKTIPIIRCEDGQMRAVCKPDGEALVWLPSDSGDSSFPTVKRSIYEYGENKAFFNRLDLKQPNTNDEITRILNRYQEENKPSVADNQKHIQYIIAKWDELDKETQQKVKQTPLLLAKDISGSLKGYQAPKNVYLHSDDLESYFRIAQQNNVYFVDLENYSKIKQDEWEKLDIKYLPKLEQVNSSYNGFKIDYKILIIRPNQEPKFPKAKSQNFHDSLDSKEYMLCNIERFFVNLNTVQDTNKMVCILWKFIIQHNKKFPIQVTDFYYSDNYYLKNIFEAYITWELKGETYRYIFRSKMFELLQQKPCIPNKNGELSCPQDISRDDIADWFHNDFVKPNEELFALFWQEEEKQAQALKDAGIDIDEFHQWKKEQQKEEELKQKNPEKWERLQDLKQQQMNLFIDDEDNFPVSPVPNPERLGQKTQKRIENAPNKGKEVKARTITTNRADKGEVRAFLKGQYQNNDKKMFCRICKQEHFKKKNGEYYFAAIPIFQNTRKDDKSNYLALCPNCEAKYREYVTNGKNDNLEKIKQAIQQQSKENCEISITFNFPDEPQKTTIRFTENHFFQLKKVFKELSVDEDKKKVNDLQTSVLLVKNEFTPVSGKNKRTVLNRHTLSVRFPDGTVICENSAINTLIKTIEKIGFEKVMSLGLKVSGEPLVDTKPQQLNRKDGKTGYKQYKNYFIISNFNNDGKVKRLQDMSDKLGLNLIITDDISC